VGHAERALDPATGLEARADLDQGLRPQQPLADLLVDGLADALIADPDEALDVAGVVVDQVVAEREDVHTDLSCAGLSGPPGHLWQLVLATSRRGVRPEEKPGRLFPEALLRGSR